MGNVFDLPNIRQYCDGYFTFFFKRSMGILENRLGRRLSAEFGDGGGSLNTRRKFDSL